MCSRLRVILLGELLNYAGQASQVRHESWQYFHEAVGSFVELGGDFGYFEALDLDDVTVLLDCVWVAMGNRRVSQTCKPALCFVLSSPDGSKGEGHVLL